MQWYMQAGKITNNLKFNIDFALPELRVKKIVTWTCHVDESAKDRYNMISGIYILTKLGLNQNFDITPLKEITDLLNGLQHPRFIRVCMNLNISKQEKIHLKNHLQIFTQNNYMNRNTSVLLLNYYVYIKMAKMKRNI